MKYLYITFLALLLAPLSKAKGQFCFAPSNVQVVSYTNTSITLDWTTGGATDWQIRFVPQGGNINTASPVNVTSKPFTIPGLSQATTYAIQVRDSCNTTVFSFWTSSLLATTACNPVNAPFTAAFDGAAWNPGPFTNDAGTINLCWRRFPATTGGSLWKTGPPNFVFNTGADNDHTSGNGQYVYVETTGFIGTGPDSAIFDSPLFDLSTISNPQLVFWYHMFGNDIEDLRVYVSDDNGLSYNLETTLSGQKQTTSTAAWKEQIINLSAYANQTIRVRFMSYETTPGFNNAICLDDVQIRQAPTCPRPQNLSSVSISNVSATIDWLTGGASDWNIEYGPAGFSNGNGILINTTNNPATISGLSANTSYDIYVRDSCGPGDVSVWEGPITITTLCNPFPAPYTENFDGSTFIPGPNFNDTGSIDNCWNRSRTDLYFWKTGPPNFTPTNTGPQGDHTTGSGQYMFTESGGFSNNSITTDLESPLIDLTSLTTPQLTFWTHMFGPDISSLKVSVDNGSGYSQVDVQNGQQQSSKTDLWKEVIVSLAAYAGDTVRIKFEGERLANGFSADISIDDIEIAETPSCPKPQNLANVSLGFDRATFSWTSGGATNWNLSYGSPGFQPNNGTIVSVGSNPGTLNGLSANTTYEVYVRDSCGPGDVSAWAGPVTITTRCTPVAAPYFENFDGASFTVGTFAQPGNFSSCWLRPLGSSYVWGVEDGNGFSAFTGPSQDHTTGSGKYIFAQAVFGGGLSQSDEAVVTSELVDLSPLNVPELTFWYHLFGNSIDSLAVFVDNGSSVSRVFGLAGQQQTAEAEAWKEAIVSLSAFANDTVAIIFKAYRSPNFGAQAEIAIDDLNIAETPTCPKPQGLTVTSTTTTTATLNWNSGGATNWQIEYGPPNFTPGSGTLVNVSSNPFTITGLNPSTQYDFYVRDSCGATDLSAWSARAQGRTACSVVAAPVLENFDGSSFVVSQFFQQPGALDPCWSRSDTTEFFWKPNTGPAPGFASGPSQDNTTGNGKYLFSAKTLFNTSKISTDVTSLPVDLSPLTNPQLRFYHHMFGTEIDRLEVQVSSGSSWNTELTINGAQLSDKTDPWTEEMVSLAAYQNDTIQVRFVSVRTTGFGNGTSIGLDDFEIRETPSCPRPSNISISNPTQNSIDISWTSGGATNWEVRYRQAGSAAPFTVVPATTNPFTLTGLSPSTAYEIFVRDSCGVGDVSIWEGPVTGSTNCGVLNFPFTENFDGGNWVPGTGFDNAGNQIDQCWSRPSNANPNFGTRTATTTSTNTGPNSDVSGSGNYLYTEASGGAQGSGEISTPQIFIPGNVGTPYFKFAYHMAGTAINLLNVDISANGGTFTNELTFNGAQQNSSSDPWKFDSIDLSGYIGDTIIVKFIGNNSGFLGDIAIDEVKLEGTALPCDSPTTLTFNNIGTDSLVVGWSSTNPNAITTLIYYDASQGVGSATTIANASSPQILNSLNPGTTYVIEVFDSCASGGVSASNIDSVTTLTCDTVTASFTSNASYLGVNFNSSGTANADSLLWVFSAGNTSNQANPLFVFPTAGTYQVSLFAFNDCGNSDTTTQSITVCDTLLAKFSYQTVGDTVFFDADSSENATGYIWDLDDGFSDTTQNVGIKYPTTGSKTVTLQVYNACGDTLSITKTVDVCPQPNADWTYTILPPVNAGLRVQFDGTLSTNANTYSWDFGDGNSATGPTPIHIYSTPGLFYQVELTVTNACGNEAKKSFKLNEISLEEVLLPKDFSLYPNPAYSSATLEWDDQQTEIQKLTLVSSNGQKVREFTLEPNYQQGTYTLELGQLPSGVYWLLVTTPQKIIHKPLTIR